MRKLIYDILFLSIWIWHLNELTQYKEALHASRLKNKQPKRSKKPTPLLIKYHSLLSLVIQVVDNQRQRAMKSFCNHKKKIKLVNKRVDRSSKKKKKVSIVHVTHGLSPLANIKTQLTRLDRDLTNLTRATLALVDPTLK